MEIKELKRIAEIMRKEEITELEWEEENFKLKLKRKTEVVQQVVETPRSATMNLVNESQELEEPEKGKDQIQEGHRLITSPIVGTFYRAPSPKADPYVKEGDIVEKNQVLCIIEAMKLMNELEAEYPCKIIKILVENAQPVEYGEPLFEVKPL